MPGMKLQSLSFYALAWHATWTRERLFPQDFEAWGIGPTCPELYTAAAGKFLISTIGGNPHALTETQKNSVESVFDFYKGWKSFQLTNLVMLEDPYLLTAPIRSHRSDNRTGPVIPVEKMVTYYGSLDPVDEESKSWHQPPT